MASMATLLRRIMPGRLSRDESGITAIEFGIVAPVLCLMLTGMFDIGFQGYAQTTIKGAMQEAGRKSSLEPTLITTSELDGDVRAAIHRVIPRADVTFTRKNYATFGDVGKPEDFTDGNGNNVCDNGEPFWDVNANDNWDTDRGAEGLGGARDAVLYTTTATYARVFPLHGFIEGMSDTVTVTGQTVLRNQPYDEQSSRVPEVKNCDDG